MAALVLAQLLLGFTGRSRTVRKSGLGTEEAEEVEIVLE